MYVYILRCADDTLYTGIASDMEKRLKQHRGLIKGGAKYTRAHGVKGIEALWSTDCGTAARKMECALKKLKRSDKEALINNPYMITGICLASEEEYSFLYEEEKLKSLSGGL